MRFLTRYYIFGEDSNGNANAVSPVDLGHFSEFHPEIQFQFAL